MYYIMWICEKDSDDTTIGGSVAATAGSEQKAVGIAKKLTANGKPCTVENEYQDIIWEPEGWECEEENY